MESGKPSEPVAKLVPMNTRQRRESILGASRGSLTIADENDLIPSTEDEWAEQAAAANRVTHTTGGFALRKIRALPPKTVREAIVNGVIHRDWLSPLPTVVEHIGDTLAVTSLGGSPGRPNRTGRGFHYTPTPN